jgi:hypothetical protein
LDLLKEGISVNWDDVKGVPQGQVSARLQRTSRLAVPQFWIEPAPSGRRIYQREGFPYGIPVLEASLDDFHVESAQYVASLSCEGATRLQARDTEAHAGQRQCGLPACASNLQEMDAGDDSRDLHKPLKQFRRVVGTRPLI